MTKTHNLSWKRDLDAKVLDVEFLLISVVQGLALNVLAVSATKPLGELQFQYWFYVATGFLFILVFWSQAIIHALSFIDWPLDLGHTFLYFLASFVEVMAFDQITHPLKWFIFTGAFLVVGGALYVYDLRLIKSHEEEYGKTPEKKRLYDHMYTRQVKELRLFVPSAILFTIFAIILIVANPSFFLDQSYHVVIAAVQTLFTFFLLLVSLKSFRERSVLITDMYKNKEN